MNCTDFDIRDYFLLELPEPERERTARHLAACTECAEELESLRHLRFALESLPDQDPPQRIGFVSDHVFEPSAARRAWNSFWHSAPKLGFASAALLSAALVTFSLRPVPAPAVDRAPVVAQHPLPPSALEPIVNEAVRKAVAETEIRQQKRTDQLLAASERRHQAEQRELMLRVADSYDMLQKRMMYSRASLLNYGGMEKQ